MAFFVEGCSLDAFLGEAVAVGCVEFWDGIVADIKLVTVSKKDGIISR